MLNLFKNSFKGISIRKQTKPAFQARGIEEFFENGQALPTKQIPTGHAWRANHLRKKSWEDLQKLWFVLLKERNLLATQKAEARRNKIPAHFFSNEDRIGKCKQSMARIKFVLNERRLAYANYVKLEREKNKNMLLEEKKDKRIRDQKQHALGVNDTITLKNDLNTEKSPTQTIADPVKRE
ncbi:hypothetical protein BB561_001807 [Smittium simulii]|uniref:Large ribosomal subunit protein uL29m n=1 Tax=Smittium simulii TaxID=133385 RepID=A0A2T9YT41_9FUNG|nr:hypothetical protein BB561_001807 [Smittium simulii]